MVMEIVGWKKDNWIKRRELRKWTLEFQCWGSAFASQTTRQVVVWNLLWEVGKTISEQQLAMLCDVLAFVRSARMLTKTVWWVGYSVRAIPNGPRGHLGILISLDSLLLLMCGLHYGVLALFDYLATSLWVPTVSSSGGWRHCVSHEAYLCCR